ncbi:MAG: molybdopterin-dependent oxidoreductase [Jiangellaceae bacterium]
MTALLRRPLPQPPDTLRRGPFRASAFRSPLRTERAAAWLGIWLGIAFAVCFVTGLISHAIQHPPDWFWWPSRPVGLYRVTQGVHVATGLACVPLLLAKLWVVYPKLFVWPAARDVAHAVSRIAVLVLVASAIFQVASGVLNIALWYAPMGYFFTTAHFWTAWIAIGAVLVHIGAKIEGVRRSVRRLPPVPPPTEPATGLTRRGLFATVGAGVGVVTLATVGQTLEPLARISPLAPRRPDIGSQGLPVNKSAASAGVEEAARDPAYRLVVDGAEARLDLSLGDLRAMPGHTVEQPIVCVEGWSADAEWTGVRVRDLLAEVGADPDADVRVESLQRGGLYRVSMLPPPHARDPLTLLAYEVNGQPLNLDHGFPCRLIAPNRPGVLQTKWVARIGQVTR